MSKVPKLRFKEFRDEWARKTLGEIFSIFNGYAFSSDDSRDAGCRWVKIADVGINQINHESASYLPFDYAQKYPKFLLTEGDYVVALTRPILGGKLKIAKVDSQLNGSLLNQRVGKLVSENDLTFVYSLLQKASLIARIENRIAGTDPPNLSPNEINSLKQSLPSLPEQQKIASFLSAVDEKIQQLTRKKEWLEQYKKGVMQQLFSGKLRFKDPNGKPYPKWEEKKLGEIGSTFNGLTGKAKEDFGIGKPYIQYKQIFDSSRIDISNCGFVQIGVDENQERVQFGDVFFTTSSETPDEVGFASVLLEQPSDVYLNSFSFGFRPNSLSELVPEFAQFLFRSGVFRKLVFKLAQGSTRYNMSKVELMKLKVSLPSKQEQQKIANFLTALDAKIESAAAQVSKVQEFKKGLLQQMFV